MKGYILDLDNTLYDENQYLHHVFLEFWDRYFQDHTTFQQICSHTLSDESRLHSQDIFKTFLELTPFGYSTNYHDELFDIYTSTKCDLSLYPDAKEFLDFLKKKKHLVAILTNGPVQAQKNKIKNLKITDIPIFYAREYGMEYEKPHPNAFLRVLDHFNLPPKECYMIGDNPHTDILGAKAIGITPILLLRGYAQHSQHSIEYDTISDFNTLKENIS